MFRTHSNRYYSKNKQMKQTMLVMGLYTKIKEKREKKKKVFFFFVLKCINSISHLPECRMYENFTRKLRQNVQHRYGKRSKNVDFLRRSIFVSTLTIHHFNSHKSLSIEFFYINLSIKKKFSQFFCSDKFLFYTSFFSYYS